MRVVFVAAAAPRRNAIGTLVAEKAEFFAERGAEVRVLLLSIARLDPRLTPFAQRVDAPSPDGPFWNDVAGSDLVFFEYSQDFPLLDWLPRLAGGRPRIVVDYFGVSPPDGWPSPQRRNLEDGARKRSLIGFADVAVVLSRFCRDELVRDGVAEDRIVQQRIPLDRDMWRPRANRPTADRKILLFVGRLAPNKRLPLAIEALARLPEAELRIAGDAGDVYAEEARRCRELATRLGVADRIRWCGPVDDLPALYREADVLVMPSIHEGLGIPVLEAQASGVPVVAARSTALVETVGDGGLLFVPDDLDDFVRCVRAALTPTIADDLRRRGLERVRGWSRADWRREFGELVERLLDAELAPRRRAVLLRSPKTSLIADTRTRSLVVPLVLENIGDLPIASDLHVNVSLRGEATGYWTSTTCELRVDRPVPAGGCERVAIMIETPDRIGSYSVSLTPEDGRPLELPLTVEESRNGEIGYLLEMADAAVAAADAKQVLPTDYVDVSDGLFGSWKRWLKRKLLGNFKVGYVDEAHRQQSEVNRQLVDAIRQLAACCRSLERSGHIAPGLPGTDVSLNGSSCSFGIHDIDEPDDPLVQPRVPGKPGAI